MYRPPQADIQDIEATAIYLIRHHAVARHPRSQEAVKVSLQPAITNPYCDVLMYSEYGPKNLGLCNVTIWVAFSRCRSATVLDAVYFNLKHEQGVRASDNGSEDGKDSFLSQ